MLVSLGRLREGRQCAEEDQAAGERWQVRQAEEGRAAGQEGRQEGCQGLSPIQPICIEILNIIFFSRLCIVLADQDCNAENHDTAGKPQLHAHADSATRVELQQRLQYLADSRRG